MWRPQLQPFFTAVGRVTLQIVALLALILIAARNPVRCLHLDVEKVNHLVLDNAKIDERNLHNFLEEHEQLLLFGDRMPGKYVHDTFTDTDDIVAEDHGTQITR
uniref:Uncharacterized protein n=1 Tax=Anopheles farauti TaxID=69004 RepID=A0A182QJB6_9DIPT